MGEPKFVGDLLSGVVVVGEAAPAVGAAGLAGWGIGRTIGHAPLGGGNTIDSNMQFLFTYFFFSQAAATGQMFRSPKLRREEAGEMVLNKPAP